MGNEHPFFFFFNIGIDKENRYRVTQNTTEYQNINTKQKQDFNQFIGCYATKYRDSVVHFHAQKLDKYLI